MNTQCIVGPAGSGKSYNLKQRIESGERMLLTSTTGISAVNLGPGVTTVHSALGFYDLRSLQRAFIRGQIKYKFVSMARKGIKTLVIDEVSMLQGEALQLIHQGALDAEERIEEINKENERGETEPIEPTGILLTGDFLQLAPIADRQPDGKPGVATYAFESPCWPAYEQNGNMTRLSKIWRQDDAKFIDALHHVRRGNGVDGRLI